MSQGHWLWLKDSLLRKPFYNSDLFTATKKVQDTIWIYDHFGTLIKLEAKEKLGQELRKNNKWKLKPKCFQNVIPRLKLRILKSVTETPHLDTFEFWWYEL